MRGKQLIRDWFEALVSFLFPRCCVVCGRVLISGEECLCTFCNIDLPRTHFHRQPDNPVERLFWGRIPLERATSFFYYRKESNYRRILLQLKYQGRKEVGEIMGRCLATEIKDSSGFFEGIDLLIPIPLHPKKLRARGYNQSEWIARGISAVTGIPVETTAVAREKHTDTQTRKTPIGRWENVEGIFCLRSPQAVEGKHVLLIDDVLTTGATLVACASCLTAVKDLRISILTLAVAKG